MNWCGRHVPWGWVCVFLRPVKGDVRRSVLGPVWTAPHTFAPRCTLGLWLPGPRGSRSALGALGGSFCPVAFCGTRVLLVGLGSFLTQQWLRSGQSDLQCAGQPAPRWAVPGDLSAAAQGSRPRGGLWFFRFSALMCDSGPRSLARSAWPCSGGGAAHWFQYQPVRPDTVRVICTVFH